MQLRTLAALALLAFLVSGWLGSGRLAQAQSAPTDTPFPTETKEALVTATYDPLTPPVTPFIPPTPVSTSESNAYP